MSPEFDVFTGERIMYPTPPHSQTLWNNKIFHFLSSIRLDRTVYPFTLKGDDYLNSRWKKALDVGVGVVGTIASAPLVLLGAGAIVAEDILTGHLPQNPIYTSYRFGFGNKKFRMHKLRSQRVDTSAHGFTDRTQVGKVLAETSVDETPQFIDLLVGAGGFLKGDIAAVGRRPLLPVDYDKAWTSSAEEVPYHRALKGTGVTEEEWLRGELPQERTQEVIDWANAVKKHTLQKYWGYKANDLAKPGLLSLFGVLGRKDIPEYERVLLNLLYERKKASLGMDLAILLSAPWAIIKGPGAR